MVKIPCQKIKLIFQKKIILFLFFDVGGGVTSKNTPKFFDMAKIHHIKISKISKSIHLIILFVPIGSCVDLFLKKYSYSEIIFTICIF